mmetsp:Transcript_13087/g.19487  ORF Transcript_13087/g.19487 Transcript_13087/m.19487 type:complete len:285 (+) Transcript_13087:67-921(+)
MRSVPSTMESVTTRPRLLDNTACNDPNPAKDEWRVSFRWPSTMRAGLDNNAHRIPDRSAATTIPPLSSLAGANCLVLSSRIAISTDSRMTATPWTGSSHSGPALIASWKPANADPRMSCLHLSRAMASASFEASLVSESQTSLSIPVRRHSCTALYSSRPSTFSGSSSPSLVFSSFGGMYTSPLVEHTAFTERPLYRTGASKRALPLLSISSNEPNRAVKADCGVSVDSLLLHFNALPSIMRSSSQPSMSFLLFRHSYTERGRGTIRIVMAQPLPDMTALQRPL